MFLDRLSERQQQSFLALATRMVLADGDVAPEEDEILQMRKSAIGDDVVAPPAEVFGTTNADVLDSRDVRVFVTFEVLLLMVADDNIHTDESKVIDEICTALEISGEERSRLQSLAEQAVADPDASQSTKVKDAVEAMVDGG